MNQEIKNIFGLHSYQEAAADFALRTPKCGLFLKMGLGKSRIALSVVCSLNPNGHVLVIAPTVIARSAWIDEIKKCGINLRYQSFLINKKGRKLSKKKRYELYEQAETAPPTMYFINRELIPDIVSYYEKKPWPFPMLIIDEMQSFKNYASKRFKALRTILPQVVRIIGLTGTPMPNSFMDLWSQIYLLDDGKRLGLNITSYRNTFFRPGRCMNGYPVEWIPLPGSKEEIYKRISDLVISMDNSVLTLPDVNYNTLYAYMDDKEIQQYREFVKTQILPLQNVDIVAVNAAVLVAKLSQMASGNIYVDNTSKKTATAPLPANKNKIRPYVHIHDHKLEMLQYIYDNEPDPILVAYHFKTDLIDIMCRFPDAVNFDGTPEMIHDWNDKKIRMLLIQPASAGFGLNLQDGGHTLVWYTCPWSLEEYIQTNARLHRQGQAYPVIIHHIITKNTVDERILKMLNLKECNQNSLLEAVEFAIQACDDYDFDEDDDIGLDPIHDIH